MSAAKKRIAVERIHKLFQLAQDMIHEDEELAQRYITIARKIAMAVRVHIPKEHRWKICRGCKKFILPGVNCRVRIQHRREPHRVITCGYCGKQMRFPIKEKTKRAYAKNSTQSEEKAKR
ncbi:MAG: ribonuclease P [Candidatus Bathyarchaeota archaeon]|nr:MAG: ribonuclease P [Candidatus Bathyarchaeota archaeon]